MEFFQVRGGLSKFSAALRGLPPSPSRENLLCEGICRLIGVGGVGL